MSTQQLPRALAQTSYGRSALERELTALAKTARGARNVALNRAAYVLGMLVAGGELDASDTELDLLAVAVDTLGLSSREAKTTIRAAMRRAARTPRSAPKNGSQGPILSRQENAGDTPDPGFRGPAAVLEADLTFAFEWAAAKTLATLSRAEERQQVLSSWDYLTARADVARLLATVQMIREVSKSQYGTPLARRLVRELEYV